MRSLAEPSTFENLVVLFADLRATLPAVAVAERPGHYVVFVDEAAHAARHRVSGRRRRFAGGVLVLRPALRTVVAMDYIIALLATVGLFVYLLYALVRPERF